MDKCQSLKALQMNRHMSPEAFSDELTEETLSHLASCDYCLENFSNYVETRSMVKAPRDMRKAILEKSRQANAQAAIYSKSLSKRLQFLCYGAKVGAAVLGAVTLLVFTPGVPRGFTGQALVPRATVAESLYGRAQNVTDRINELSYKIIHMEVVQYDKKEK